MNKHSTLVQTMLQRPRVIGFAIMAALSAPLLAYQYVSAAACAAPSVDYGRITSSISAPAAGTYRIWTRMFVPNTTNNTYLLEVDGNKCFNVGGSGVTANAWTWVAHQNGDVNSKTDTALTSGAHSLKLIGNKTDVKIDRIVISSDLACVPTGFGDNCKPQADTTPPATVITAPTGTVKGSAVAITATASDATGVLKTDFYVDGVLLSSDTTAPYSAVWDTTKVADGNHQISVRAYDNAGNMGSDTDTIAVSNGDTQAPTAPTGVVAQAVSATKTKVSWTAGKDNIGVTGYTLYRNDVPLSTLGAVTSYEDATVSPNTSYTYKLVSRDAAGNISPISTSASVKTPPLATPDTQAPGAPRSVAANVVSQSQINLTWTESTDNVRVTGYDVFRSQGGGVAQKIGSAQSTSYGDTGLNAGTKYAYYVIARDAAGNMSGQSQTVEATTQVQPPTNDNGLYTISGTVRDSAGKGIRHARIRFSVGDTTYLYRTNRAGNYRIVKLPAGTYNLVARKFSYEPSQQSVTIANSNITKDFSLNKLNGNR